MQATYPDVHVPQWQGRRLRGFFASGQESGSLLHNHGETGQSIYRYPLIQYKVLRQVPTIVALEEGIRDIYPLIMERSELQLGDQCYPCGKLDLELKEAILGDSKSVLSYRFRSPWFGLNQENYQTYTALNAPEKKVLLERVLVGNIISLAKGLGITVEARLQVESALTERTIRFKDEAVLGFLGTVSVNYQVPDFMGIGKSVSRGFGTISRYVEPSR